VATLLHIARGIPIDHDIFTQDDVSKFRNGIYAIFYSNLTPDPKNLLSLDFVTLFFPYLTGKVKMCITIVTYNTITIRKMNC
jgi:hypothetical protein